MKAKQSIDQWLRHWHSLAAILGRGSQGTHGYYASATYVSDEIEKSGRSPTNRFPVISSVLPAQFKNRDVFKLRELEKGADASAGRDGPPSSLNKNFRLSLQQIATEPKTCQVRKHVRRQRPCSLAVLHFQKPARAHPQCKNIH